MIRIYYILTKPGIIFGNILTTLSGFFLASKGVIHWTLFLATILGLSLVIASACVFNNYLDRFEDAKMARTKNRPLAKGLISNQSAIVFASILGLGGLGLLFYYTNLLTTMLALSGFLIYVILYTLGKYHSPHATLVGSLAGAVPPVVGYCAVSNQFDLGALLLFMIIVLWQMPHFFAIAMYRQDDYAAASIPVLPVRKGAYTTKIHMLLYVTAFLIAALMLTVFGYTGYAYLITAISLGLAWLWLCIKGFQKKSDDKVWAKQMFRFSLVVVTILCVGIMISVNNPLSG